MLTIHMDVGRFVRFMTVEVEPIRTRAQHRRHAPDFSTNAPAFIRSQKPQLLRAFGADKVLLCSYPRLAPWAAFLRSFGAGGLAYFFGYSETRSFFFRGGRLVRPNAADFSEEMKASALAR